MKTLKSYKVLFIMVMIFSTNKIIAQSINNNIPVSVINAMAVKYPKAEIKNWSITNNTYTAKTRVNGHRCQVTFDQKGDWVRTATKINWPWSLPPAVKASFKKSKYKNWNMYSVKLIDKPSGQFYQITVDDRNHPVDMFHQNLVTEKRLVEIKSDGELIKESGTNENAAL